MHIARTHIQALLSVSALMIATGTIFYRFSEDWEWIDALYFSVVTMATVGYGDHVPVSAAGKIFTIPYILISVTLFLMLANSLSHYLHDYSTKKANRKTE